MKGGTGFTLPAVCHQSYRAAVRIAASSGCHVPPPGALPGRARRNHRYVTNEHRRSCNCNAAEAVDVPALAIARGDEARTDGAENSEKECVVAFGNGGLHVQGVRIDAGIVLASPTWSLA